MRWIHAADLIPNSWNHGRATARDSEQLIIIREMATAGRQIHAADLIPGSWNHGRAAARDSETAAVRWIHATDQMPGSWNHGQKLGDSGRETDPCGSQRLRAADNHPGTDRRRRQPGDSSGRETDPCSGRETDPHRGSDAEQLELWPETRRQRPGDGSTQRIRCRADAARLSQKKRGIRRPEKAAEKHERPEH